jgi:outer membrane protein OmpA-like peptidoglycan-associated protein
MPRWGWLLLAGCPKKPPPEPEEALPQAVESKLQLVSVAPQTISPDEPTSVIVYGAGFQKGLKGWVGEVAAVRINWRSENQVELSIPGLSPGAYDVVVQNPGGADDRLREGLTVRGERGGGCAYVVLYFETDRAALTEAAARTLLSLVSCYQASDDKIRVAGFADERGTTDYNLALSYERAMTVKSFLREAGLDPGRMPVQSFGEERPAVPGSSEEAWALNRRVEVTLDLE